MRTVHMIWSREVRAFVRAFSCGVSVAAFLAVAGWTFVMLVRRYEGSVLQVQTLWGLSVAPWLPLLSAVVTMRLFAEERASGMIELLLAAPLRERDLVIGKFLSALTIIAVALSMAVLVPALVLPSLCPAVQGLVRASALAATSFLLLAQASAWCAVGTLISVLFRNPAAAAVCAMVVCGGLPVASYAVVLAWMPSVRSGVAWMPLLAQVYDFSTGQFSTGVLILYGSITLFCLFACSKALACLRLRG